MASISRKKSLIIKIVLPTIALVGFSLLMELFFDLSAIQSFTKDEMKSQSIGDLVFYTIIAAPLIETFLFQYVPFLLLGEKKTSLYIISSGLLFGASHYFIVKDELLILIGSLAVGCYLSYVFITLMKAFARSKWTSFLGTSLAHMSLNAITIISISLI